MYKLLLKIFRKYRFILKIVFRLAFYIRFVIAALAFIALTSMPLSIEFIIIFTETGLLISLKLYFNNLMARIGTYLIKKLGTPPLVDEEALEDMQKISSKDEESRRFFEFLSSNKSVDRLSPSQAKPSKATKFSCFARVGENTFSMKDYVKYILIAIIFLALIGSIYYYSNCS